MVRTLKGDTMEEIVEDFHTKGHLERKWNSITSEEARNIARTDYEYSKLFFENLARNGPCNLAYRPRPRLTELYRSLL